MIQRIYGIRFKGAERHAVEANGEWRLLEGDVFGPFERGAQIEREGLTLLPPVRPSKIVAIGLNYRDHALETRRPLPAEPMLFIKPSTAVIGPGDPIQVPTDVGRVDHEAELGVVIGRRASHVTKERALGYVLGYICVNDVTARELQARDIQFTRAKGFDTFAPLGPCVAVGLDPTALALEGWVNDVRRQASNTRELIFGVDHLVAFVSGVMTLLPGDVISTGTPSGIGPIRPGDRVTIKVEGIGELTNPVEARV